MTSSLSWICGDCVFFDSGEDTIRIVFRKFLQTTANHLILKTVVYVAHGRKEDVARQRSEASKMSDNHSGESPTNHSY